MDQLEVILSRTRKLARDKQLDLDTATQIAIDEAAETHNEPLDEMLLSVAAKRELSGLGVLQPLLDNPEIEEIWINRPNQIHFADQTGHSSIDLELSASQIRNLCFRMLAHSKRRIDRLTPYVDASLVFHSSQ